MFVAFDKEEFAMMASKLFAQNLFDGICNRSQMEAFCKNIILADMAMVDLIKKERILGVIDLNVFSKSENLVAHLVKKNTHSEVLIKSLEKNSFNAVNFFSFS